MSQDQETPFAIYGLVNLKTETKNKQNDARRDPRCRVAAGGLVVIAGARRVRVRVASAKLDPKFLSLATVPLDLLLLPPIFSSTV